MRSFYILYVICWMKYVCSKIEWNVVCHKGLRLSQMIQRLDNMFSFHSFLSQWENNDQKPCLFIWTFLFQMKKQYTCVCVSLEITKRYKNCSHHFLSKKNTIDKWVLCSCRPIVLLDWTRHGLLSNAHVTLLMIKQMKNELLDIFHRLRTKDVSM